MQQTTCKRGHIMHPHTTYARKDCGGVRCKRCHAEDTATYRKRQKAKRTAAATAARAAQMRAQTHCVRGHAFTPENTYIDPGTERRRCKRCHADRVHYYRTHGPRYEQRELQGALCS